MKIAILHDFFGSIGGGEKLVLELARSLRADIFTTEIDADNLKRINKSGVKVILLGKAIGFPVLKQISSSFIFSRAKLKGYDAFILSGNWAIFAAKNNEPSLLYCHTPVRMFYQDYNSFYKLAPWWAKPFFVAWVFFHKRLLEHCIQNIGSIVANSQECARRVKKYYKRNCAVVNPPIAQYAFRKSGDFWLSVNRIYPHKRIELQVEAFRRMPGQKLVIVGGTAKGDHSMAYLKKMTSNLPKNIIFIGEVDEAELSRLYSDCKAFITTSQNEDFGMTVLEAMSAGKPVVATNEGGYLETVVSGKTGILIRPTVDEVISAVRKISANPKRFRSACESQSKKYSSKVFISKMKKIINEDWEKSKDEKKNYDA